jgi:hypothetical protein
MTIAEGALNFPPKKVKVHYTPWEWLWKFGSSPRCHYCDLPLTLKTSTKDHLVPLCRGGSNLIDNLVPACLACNQAKGTMTEEEYWVLLSTASPEAITTSPLKTALEDRADEYGLLKRIAREREKVSWFWQNPAEQKLQN